MKEKYKNMLTGALIPIIAYGVYCYGKAFKAGSDDVSKIRTLMQSSPRVECVVQTGDSIYSLREKFFPIRDKEFNGLDSIIFVYNHKSFYPEGYKSLAADNIFGQMIRKENHTPWYVPYNSVSCKDGKISVPIRESH
jgi:hypothetical protein